MTYNTVSVTGNNIFGNAAGQSVIVTCTPVSVYFDTVNNAEIDAPVATAVSNSAGAWTLTGLIDPTPTGSGMAWKLTVVSRETGISLYSQTVQIAFSNGSAQNWLSLAPPPAPSNASIYLTAPGTAAKGGQSLVATADNSSALSWAGPLGVLAVTEYAPASLATMSNSTTTFAPADAANLSVTFTAPASGKVVVALSATAQGASAGVQCAWALTDHVSGAVYGYQHYVIQSTIIDTYGCHYRIAGLTPGQSYHMDWSHACTFDSFASTIYAQGISGPTVGGQNGNASPATMVVFAA